MARLVVMVIQCNIAILNTPRDETNEVQGTEIEGGYVSGGWRGG